MIKFTIKDLFASVDYISHGHITVKMLFFVMLMGLFIYLSYFIYSKLLYRKSDLNTDQKLKYSLLWSFGTFIIIFTILVIILFYFVGFHSINWSDYRTYLAFFKDQGQSILPYLLTFILDIVFYIIKNSQLRKSPNIL